MQGLHVFMTALVTALDLRIFSRRSGVGLSYLLRPQAGIILRADITQGKDDNQAFYLTLKNPF